MPATSDATDGRRIAAAACYDLTADRDAGIIRVIGNERLWLKNDIRAYLVDLEAAIVRCQLRTGAVRILVDLTGSPIQKPEVVGEFRRVNDIITERDKVALVVRGVLAKMQTSRVSNTANIRAFMTWQEACAWLGISEAFEKGDAADRPAKAA
jgi:hypothetical protein